jgi:polyisoprenoid-binding protein YceI
MKKSHLLALLLFPLIPSLLTAAEQTFDFKDPKGVNQVRFTLDAPLEAISGNANGVSGTLTLDPEKPGATRGSIVIEAKTLSVENAVMKEHKLGTDWQNVAEHPTITFTLTSLSDLKMEGGKASATAKGKFSLMGVEKEISVPASVTLLKGKLGDRTGGKMQGDLVVLRTEFTIKRSDYGVNPKAPTDKVSDNVVVSMAIAGSCPK